MDIISHSGTIIVSTDAEAGADKAMQIHSGILMKLKLSKAAKVEFIKVRLHTLKLSNSKILSENK